MKRADRNSLARELAATFLAGPWSRRAMAERAMEVLGHPRARQRVSALVRRVVDAFGSRAPIGRDGRLAAFIAPRLRCIPDASGFGHRPIARHPCLEPAQKGIAVRMDLSDFFGSIEAARVHAIFVSLGYPWAVCRLLTGLTTHRTSSSARHGSTEHAAWSRLRTRHLPQGAPTSPALANLAAFGLDVRLSALASKAGARYSRYADDLAFSGDERLARSVQAFHVLACAIVMEEGFRPNTHKTRVMRANVRQQVTGLVVNALPSLPRDELDRLKAILHNCVVHGPASQNREGRADFRAWLGGRVAWVAAVHPTRGARLRAMLERISW